MDASKRKRGGGGFPLRFSVLTVSFAREAGISAMLRWFFEKEKKGRVSRKCREEIGKYWCNV